MTDSRSSNFKLKRAILQHRSLIISILILMVITSLIVYCRVKLQITVGPFWDTYSYLANALEFAGQGTGYYELDRPPFLPFLTSLVFRGGYISETAIFWMDGIIFFLGVVGLYLLFKMRFNEMESLAGCFLFISFPLILAWLGVGYVDVAAVAFSIWALYFTVKAVKTDPRFFYLAFPVAAMAFLTRFTAGFIIFPIALYILMGRSYLRDLGYMVRGVLLGLVVLVPFLFFFYKKTGDFLYPIIWSLTFRSESPLEHFGYSTDPFFYLKNLGSYISTQGSFHEAIYYLLILILILGVILYIIRIKTVIRSLKDKKNIFSVFWMKFIVILGLILGFFLTLNQVHYIISELIFFIICYFTYSFLQEIHLEKIDIDLLFLSWFATQFISQSLFSLKVDRYFITMAPAIAYFIILGVHEISDKYKITRKDLNLTSLTLSSLMIILALSSTTIYFYDAYNGGDNYMTADFSQNKILTNSINSASSWMISYDPNYKNESIRSDFWPAFVWTLRINTSEMPRFTTTREVNHELEKNNNTYYLSLQPNLNLNSYQQIQTLGNITIYQKDPSRGSDLSRMLFIGEGWNHYLDQVLGLNVAVIYEGIGRFSIGESTYVDGHSLDYLKKYPYLALYTFKWHDRSKMEQLIYEYVDSGGTVIIDASGNLDGVFYNLDDSVFLNTTITRRSLRPNPNITIDPSLGAGNPQFAPFTSDGQTWYGADYQSVNGDMESLVTADGRTLIGVQRIGNGKIIWIGYNLVWHAFHMENQQEMELIQKAIGLE